ncbi:beta-glucosidase BglX [Paenibacillus thiaminolyticus]|uniref:beta-glucosidase n=1 Tax=Paenibacillus thiaminolyticus TaxID=49283 RepID=A0AAP9DZG6_PANTH|nr:beta-glucosidase BglX [Paenibacillus thiaminolyticus]MCY9534202.1 beta-glucosidase BglX [Paenibacillus thiaminolyticus]MCY9599983.1 beta-glucosidase BglX [Paenibacillus thiaminolyticus]MCY9608142.1 beta-glucosidase BglX [Paenibacillus thiaminolyticus]MCY9615950.1 beta-glucosidase BglX [Paenibacillus thiaminolyticus]MCY9618361.1 beta-glucosidase BglX [Paenibacillus thiaminolyticus]
MEKSEKSGLEQWRSRAEELLGTMTLAEKIGQTVQYGRCEERERELIAEGKVGSLLNVHGADKVNELQRIAVERSRLGIPLLIGDDVIHGFRTIFPIPLAEAASWDLDAMEKNACIAAIEAAAEGIRWTFAPMADLTREPRWGRIAESTGEDVYLSSLAAAAKVRGFQSLNAEGFPTVAACVKHFAGYGWVEGGRDYDTTDMSERTLRETVLPPYLGGIQAGALTVMSAFSELNGVPATGSSYLLRDILREEWGFTGMVVSDWESIEELIYHGYAEDRRDSARRGLLAGVDMDMHSGVYLEHLESLVEESPELMKLLDEAVLRILMVKFQLGLFERPYVDAGEPPAAGIPAEHAEQARDSARKSIVLLQNDSGILPLDDERHRKIALIGPLADDRHNSMGCWAWKGRDEDVVTVWDAFQSEIGPHAEVCYEPGSGINEAIPGGIDRAVELAKQCDVAVVTVGESEAMTGEHYNVASITLPACQERLIRELKEKTATPVIVVLMNGRPLATEWVHRHADAVVEAWHLGTMTGSALADVLTGRHNPSGRLPVTIPRSTGQIPIYYNRKNTGRPHLYEDYIDCDDSPLYPFGYGLSYTTFHYDDLQLERSAIHRDESVSVSVRVSNAGPRAGEETVQLYIRDLVGSTTRPVKELKGFRKVFLQPGESRTVSFELTPAELGLLDEQFRFKVEPGKFHIWIGPHSEEGLQGELTVT